MISREMLLQLAVLQSPKHDAVSFYFQPPAPRDKSHRDEVILIKDLVRQAQREAEKTGRKPSESDLRRLITLAEGLANIHRAKAVFACASQGVWQEFDLPALPGRTVLIVNRRFHLRPLAMAQAAAPRTGVLLIDRKHARVFDVSGGETREVEDLFGALPRRGRSDGWGGYDAGHAERHVENETMHHVKHTLDRVLGRFTGGAIEKLVIGCRDEMWPELEPHLHPYLRQALAGRFSADVATATPDLVRERAERVLREREENRGQELVREVLGEARRNGRGATGLRQVLEALEMGEVQALVMAETFSAAAVECGNCGHVDARDATSCAVCGGPTRPLDDVADALVTLALRNHAELLQISGDGDLERAGGVGALLRFRADQNTPARVAS
jgi:peptide subunit release factor 1 (eRF1)